MLFTNQTVSKSLLRGVFFAPALVLLSPSLAHAASPHHGIESLVIPFFNFTIFVLIFLYVFRKHIAPKLKARSVDIRERIKVSGQVLRNVEVELQSLRERLSEIAAEREEMKKNYDQEGDEMARSIIAKAQDSARVLSRDTARRVEQEFKQAAAEVKSETVSLALRQVKSELQTSLTSDKDAELRRNALQTMVM